MNERESIATGISHLQTASLYQRQRQPPEVLEQGYIVAFNLVAAPDRPGQLYLRVIDRTSKDLDDKAIVEPYTQASMRTSLGLHQNEDFVQWLKSLVPQTETVDIKPANRAVVKSEATTQTSADSESNQPAETPPIDVPPAAN